MTPSSHAVSRRFFWLGLTALPLLLLATCSLAIRVADLDLRTARLFYLGDGDWIGATSPWAQLLYDFGNKPHLLLGIGGLLALIASLRWPRYRPWRRPGLFFFLCLLLGPGLVVNAGFKEFFARPRPRQVVEFGGQATFLPVWQPGHLVPGQPRRFKSFPSGHAASAFYMMLPFFLLYPRRRRAAWTILVLGLAYGLVMGLARMVVGAHWLSDVLWAGGFVWLTGLFVARALGLLRLRRAAQAASFAAPSEHAT